MTLTFRPIPTDHARHFQTGGKDAYGNAPELSQSDGPGNPCRHCLAYIDAGKPMLILAYRPFDEKQPYAETGPIFLCAEHCAGFEGDAVPDILTSSPDYLIRGYDRDHRIVYGTGKVVPSDTIELEASEVFSGDLVAYIHVRSARNNCYQLRIDRS